MNGTILLDYGENTKKIEDEEKLKFLIDLISQMGIPIDDLYDDSVINQSADQKAKLKNIFSTYGIQVIDDLDGNMQVYIDEEKIADWSKPIYFLKKDLSKLNYKKQLFLEMTVKFWTIFEQQE